MEGDWTPLRMGKPWAAPQGTWLNLGQGWARQSCPCPLHFLAEPVGSGVSTSQASEGLAGLADNSPCDPGLARLLEFRHSVNRGVASERFQHSSPVPPAVPSCGLSGGESKWMEKGVPCWAQTVPRKAALACSVGEASSGEARGNEPMTSLQKTNFTQWDMW